MKKLSLLKNLIIYFLFTGLLLTSCGKDNTRPSTKFGNGVFIANEGAFGKNDASVSYYDYDKDTLYNNVFKNANGYSPGDVLQSLYIDGQRIYLIVNNSNKIVIADADTLKEEGVIGDLPQPRYMVAYQGIGYVTCWGDNSVRIIDLNTNQVTDTLFTGTGPEHMLIRNGMLLVANSGAFTEDSTLSVIDISTRKVVRTIVVGTNPQEMVEDKNGNLWVLCYGIVDYTGSGSTVPAKLVELDGSTLEVMKSLALTGFSHPGVLDINAEGTKLYFCDKYSFPGVFELPVDGTTATGICTDQAYGFTLVKDHKELFVMIADPSWTNAGTLKRYDLSGNLLGTYTTGIGPNGGVLLKMAEQKK